MTYSSSLNIALLESKIINLSLVEQALSNGVFISARGRLQRNLESRLTKLTVLWLCVVFVACCSPHASGQFHGASQTYRTKAAVFFFRQTHNSSPPPVWKQPKYNRQRNEWITTTMKELTLTLPLLRYPAYETLILCVTEAMQQPTIQETETLSHRWQRI